MSGRRTRAALVAAAALWTVAAGPGRAEPSARVERVVGTVEIRATSDAPWAPAKAGDSLPPGSSLHTGVGARAEISLDGARARVYEESLARFPEAPLARRVNLDRGAATFNVEPRESAPFEVETPSAVALAKGTSFTVTADPDGSTVSVRRGLVGVRTPDSLAREFLVHPGFGVMGGAGRPFALGLLDQKGDPWEAWSAGAAPSRPLQDGDADGAVPASPDPGRMGGPARDDLHIRLLGARGARRVQIVGTAGIDATFTRGDLGQVLRGNSALLGGPLIATLHARGVTPVAFARQILDNL